MIGDAAAGIWDSHGICVENMYGPSVCVLFSATITMMNIGYKAYVRCAGQYGRAGARCREAERCSQ